MLRKITIFPVPATAVARAARRLAVLAALGGMLGACQSEQVMFPATPQKKLEDRYPITVAPKTESLTLSPRPIGKKLGDKDTSQINGFAGGYLQQGHGPLAIIMSGVPSSPQALAQMQAVNGALRERGVARSQIEWRIASPDPASDSGESPGAPAGKAAAPAQLTFTYTRYVASVEKPCENWSKDFSDYHDNKSWENFGCAHQHNLAAMVADPLDLKRPRDVDPIDADRRTVVLKSYREGKATAAERSEAEKGMVSEVAK